MFTVELSDLPQDNLDQPLLLPTDFQEYPQWTTNIDVTGWRKLQVQKWHARLLTAFGSILLDFPLLEWDCFVRHTNNPNNIVLYVRCNNWRQVLRLGEYLKKNLVQWGQAEQIKTSIKWGVKELLEWNV